MDTDQESDSGVDDNEEYEPSQDEEPIINYKRKKRKIDGKKIKVEVDDGYELVGEELIILEFGKKYSKFKSFPESIKFVENELKSSEGVDLKDSATGDKMEMVIDDFQVALDKVNEIGTSLVYEKQEDGLPIYKGYATHRYVIEVNTNDEKLTKKIDRRMLKNVFD